MRRQGVGPQMAIFPSELSPAATQLPEAGDRLRSKVEEEVVRLFDETRVPLQGYLSAFPLGIADSEDGPGTPARGPL